MKLERKQLKMDHRVTIFDTLQGEDGGWLLGWVDCILTFHCLPSPPWADGNLAESAGLVGNMVTTQIKVNPTQ